MRPMRIAHISATFPPYWGGTGNVCFYNARELSRRGHEVRVYTPKVGSTITEEMVEGMHVDRLKPFIHFRNAYLVPGLISLRNFDVIHLHFPFFGGEFAAIAAHKHQIPLVITYHQDVHLKGIPGIVEKLIRITVSKWVLNHAARVLFTSLDYSQASYARYILRGKENRISELPNGVDTQHFCPGQINPLITQKYNLLDRDLIVLLVARLDRPHFFKGVPIFLQAIVNSPQLVKAIIIGEGDLKEEYIRVARSLNLQNRVIFAGQISAEDLPQYYRMAKVTVLPSTTMGEAFGLVLVESMACGTPVIASNLPGVRTVVSDGKDGYLVKPGDAPDLAAKLKQMLELTTDMRRGMGAAGRQKVEERYTWSKIVDRLEEVYFSVVCG